MVKVLENDPMFKKGSYTGQQSDGLYMDGVLVEAVSIFAKKIVEDMQFLGLFCSSTFGVRTGKSTLAQQLCYYYTKEVNRMHGLDLKFDHNNVVFKTEKLIKKAHTLPKYSALILDEGDDLTEHSASEKMREIKKFMRKSGQLNLFIIFILPDFFEMPKSIAMHRSNFLIDVKFEGEFERGHFDYYNFRDKKKLYARGKKYGDYDSHPASIRGGRFVNKYCVDEKTYRAMKLRDLKEIEEEEDQGVDRKTRRLLMVEFFGKLYYPLKEKYDVSVKELASYFGVGTTTGEKYMMEYRKKHLPKEDKEKEDSNVDAQVKGSISPLPSNDTVIHTSFDSGSSKAAAVYPDPITTPQLVQDNQSESPFHSSRINLNSFESLKNDDNEKEEQTK